MKNGVCGTAQVQHVNFSLLAGLRHPVLKGGLTASDGGGRAEVSVSRKTAYVDLLIYTVFKKVF